MPLARGLLLVFAMTMACSPAGAQTPAQAPAPARPAEPAGSLYVVTYFDIAPAAAGRVEGVLRQFAGTARKADGNLEFIALREIARPERFAIVETWRDAAAFTAHGAAMKALGSQLQAVLTAPFDMRQFRTLAVAAPAAGADTRGAAVYVLTHVDVFPAGKDQAAALVKQQVADSRQDHGVLRYDAVIWDGHPNHFHLIEAWAGRAAREGHALAAHSREFRAKVAPLEGAFYDERMYAPLH